jgi:hypothetical protein
MRPDNHGSSNGLPRSKSSDIDDRKLGGAARKVAMYSSAMPGRTDMPWALATATDSSSNC